MAYISASVTLIYLLITFLTNNLTHCQLKFFLATKYNKKEESALSAHFLEYGSKTTRLCIYTAFNIGDDMKMRSPFLNYIADYMLVRQYSLCTVDTYLRWIASYIHFHDKRHDARRS